MTRNDHPWPYLAVMLCGVTLVLVAIALDVGRIGDALEEGCSAPTPTTTTSSVGATGMPGRAGSTGGVR